MITAGEVVELYDRRSQDQGPHIQGLKEILDLYNGDIAVPLPEFDANERPAVANIARQAIDQVAQRIASVFPEINVSPSSPRKKSRQKASDRRRALYGFHQQNATQRKMRRRARFLQAYASTPVSVLPDFATGLPSGRVRNPLGTYAARSGDPDQIVPEDCIFATRQTMGWLRAKYPDKWARLSEPEDTSDTAVDVLEYVDAEVMWLIATKRGRVDGRAWEYGHATLGFGHSPSKFEALAVVPNRIERVPVVIPGTITLGEQESVFHQVIGMYRVAAEFDALSRIAVRNGILPEAWLISNPNEDAVMERTPNRYTGEPGRVSGGRIEFRTTDQQFTSRTAIGDLERAQRLTAQIPAELGGEAASNVRTGRRGDQLLSAVLDFPVQEAHQLFEESLEIENELHALTDLRYFTNELRIFHVNFSGHEKGDLEYVPGELWMTSDGKRPAVKSKVSYFAAGLDAGDRIVGIGQRIGIGMMSKETGMQHDPLIDDVEAELIRIRTEEAERAFAAQVDQLVADPNSALSTQDKALYLAELRKGSTVEEAFLKAEAQALKRAEDAAAAQSQSQAPPGGPGAPGQVVEGLPAPGGPGGGGPAIGDVPESVSNLSGLLTGLRTPSAFIGPQG